ncbi:TPA: hypothetical protein N0F65_002080 [Lagenidium giganteum]|uniref:FYVE-type domain-containing protein n=1 Tax=Lagenidium giganteum TaxID=4803 RepID=A0AAV2ZA70_9STRA|nr:TPA: hypothetical protein N0F65_002080 [Lagenidium giganteum]
MTSNSTSARLSITNSNSISHDINAAIAKLGMRSASSLSASNLSTGSRSASASQYEEAAALHDLSADRRNLLIEFIDKSVDDAYNLCHGFGRIKWSPSKNREGVSICRARAEEEGRLDAAVRGKCNVNATFQEMMDTLTTETTDDFVAHETAVNPSEFLDGQVLYTLVPRTPEDRFVCVKWHCIKSLAPSVAKHRDYIYVEVVDQFEDRDGKKIGYRLSKSVELDELSSIDTSHLFVRGKTLTLHTFSALPTGNLEFYTMMINDLGDRLPTWLVHKVVDTAALRSACIRDHINLKRMDLLVLAKPSEMVPLTKRVCCVVCTKSFSLVRKKYNCFVCGEVICNQCSVHQLVASQGISETVGKRKARICVKCSTSAKTRELPRRTSMRQSDLQPDDRRSSSSGHQHMSHRYSGDKHDSESRRSGRSTSTADTSSVDSTNSNEDGGARIYPTSNRSSIPQMFQQFRSSSSISGQGSSSITLEDAGLEGLDLEERIASSDRTSAHRSVTKVDLGVGKYKTETVQAEEIQIEERESANSKQRRSNPRSSSSMRTSGNNGSELIIEEMTPANRESMTGSARMSISAEEPEVTIVKPVVIRKISRRSSVRRKSVEKDSLAAAAEAAAEQFRDSIAQAPPPPAPVEQGVEGIQLADLQMHLDRMTQISENLRSLNIMEKHRFQPKKQSEAMDSLADFEKKANAEAAAAIAASFGVGNDNKDKGDGSEDEATQLADDDDLEYTIVDAHDPILATEARRSQSSIEDGANFSGFLTDSSFVDMGEVAENAPAGWKAVHSKTTGKIYYYNESCGTTSWTFPTTEGHKDSAYMVL